MSSRRIWPAVMVDIETLGTADDAVILEIAAQCFDLATLETGPAAHWVLDPKLQKDRSIDASTVEWWMKKIAGGQAMPLMAGGQDLLDVVDELFQWWFDHGHLSTELWCRGSFDARILEHVYRTKHWDGPPPWDFWNVRDQRTVLDWMGVKPTPSKHVAPEDVELQIEDLFRAEAKRRSIKEEVA